MLFDWLFDFNKDGKLDTGEEFIEYMLFQEIMGADDEDEK